MVGLSCSTASIIVGTSVLLSLVYLTGLAWDVQSYSSFAILVCCLIPRLVSPILFPYEDIPCVGYTPVYGVIVPYIVYIRWSIVFLCELALMADALQSIMKFTFMSSNFFNILLHFQLFSMRCLPNPPHPLSLPVLL